MSKTKSKPPLKKQIVSLPIQPTSKAAFLEEFPGFIAAGFIALAFIIYLKSLQGFFIYGDDEHMIVKNTFLTSWKFIPRLLLGNIKEGFGQVTNHWRPVQMMIYFAVAQIAGLKPWAFHMINVFLQGLNGFLLLLLLRQLFGNLSFWVLSAVSLLWMNHPIHVEDVAMINGTATPLHGLLMLLASWAFLRAMGTHLDFSWRDPERRLRMLWPLFFFILALGSKESAVVLPALLLALHSVQWKALHPHDQWPIKEWVLIHAPFWVLAVGYVVLRLTALDFGGTLNFYDKPTIFTEHLSYRIYTLFTILAAAFKILIVPVGLHPERQWPVYASLVNPVVLGSLAALLAVISVGIWFWRREPKVTLGVFWFFVSYAPMSNLAAKINALFWEHWLYVPSIGFAIAFLALANFWPSVRRWIAPGAWAAAMVLSVSTFGRSAHWMDSASYFSYVLRYEPNLAKAWNNLAMAVSDRKQYRDAIEYYHRAIKLDDSYAESHHNLGNVYLNLNLISEAQGEFRRAIEMNPRFYHSYISLASIDLARGNAGQAILYLETARSINPYIPGITDLIARLRMSGN